MFAICVSFYLIVPVLVIPAWTYHEQNWWLLLGIVASLIAPQVAQRKGSSIGGLLFLASLIFFFTKGIHNYFTFFPLCALWSYFFFQLAETIQIEGAKQTLITSPEVFQREIATDGLYIWYKRDCPQPDSTAEADQRWLRGYNAFEAAKEHYKARNDQEAIARADTAEDCGYSDPDLFSLRGACLQTLQWDFDAIDDFSRAISLQPNDCNHYFQRALSLRSVGDLDGFFADIREAIRIAKTDTPITRIYNDGAREMGWPDAVAIYEAQMTSATGLPDVVRAMSAEQAKLKGRRPRSQ